jgi:rare lipoprotein A
MRYRITPGSPALAVVLFGLVLAGCAEPPRAAVGPAAEADAIAASSGRGEVGKATWYGPRHHGRRTASGEIFDRHGMTAAHRSLPMGTRVRVTNLATDQTVIVRINDRCRCPGVLIDLSQAAARSIGIAGTARVRMERL